MKTIGILGGMSAASTQIYYQYLCDRTRDTLGGLHSPDLLIRSVNFAEIEHWQMQGNWRAAGNKLNHEAQQLEPTRFTMEQDFYLGRLQAANLHPIVPDASDRLSTHDIIYNELCKNVIVKSSQMIYEQIAQRLIDNGADCLILGCTEVGMLLNEYNVNVPVFDTTKIHCEAALSAALA